MFRLFCVAISYIPNYVTTQVRNLEFLLFFLLFFLSFLSYIFSSQTRFFLSFFFIVFFTDCCWAGLGWAGDGLGGGILVDVSLFLCLFVSFLQVSK